MADSEDDHESEYCHEYGRDEIVESIDSESLIAKRWLTWCRSQKLVKCVESAVPEGILPKSCKGILIDVKICAKGPDDKVYGAHKEFRDKIARGNCVLELSHKAKNGTTSGTKYFFLVFALKKFSGGMGDEDDCPTDQNTWQNYFIKPLASARRIVCTRKANGEAAHISSRKFFKQNYFCVGSKNVHMLVKDKDDIQKYTDSRYLVARTVAETFFDQVMDNSSIEEEKRIKLVDHIQKEKCTVVCEILQPKYQHVENLSHLESPELRFICWTSYKSLGECDNLCVLAPNIALDQASNLGLKTVDYEIIDASNAEDYMAKVRSEFGYEGRVMYFLDSDDKVIGVLKKKTAWYIILRAIREKTCHFCSRGSSYTPTERSSKISKRIQEIQTWIGFSDSYKKSWTELGVAFGEWVVKSTKKAVTNSVAVRAQFPILWQQFLNSDEKRKEIYVRLEKDYS